MEDNEKNITTETETNEANVVNEPLTNEISTVEEPVTIIEKGEKKKGNTGVVIVIVLLIIAGLVGTYFILFNSNNKLSGKTKTNNSEKYSAYRLSGNSLEDFDLYFLQLENENKNKIYSPLSIKYALEMLEEGANGETKEQISSIVGDYNAKKYTNNSNMSFANALFIKDSFKDSVKESYTSTLSSKYNAEVVYDSFKTPDALNSWVSDKTFKLVNNMANDISDDDFILVNALAIDMEWVNKIQSENKDYFVNYAHRKFSAYVGALRSTTYRQLDFKGVSYKAKAAQISAVANKYDIVKTLGEEKIREVVGAEYKKWLDEGAQNSCVGVDNEPSVDEYLDKYIKEIDTDYNDISSSTDFEFYDDDNIKVFAKDLKEYDGTTLQYIGIMPKNDKLTDYVKNLKSTDLNTIISNLKPIELDSFKEGVITKIDGVIPMFKFDYELKLVEDLNKLGITNVFDSKKADLSNLTESKSYINEASHKANIEFSNDGIKAAASTMIGGKGAGGCGFDYEYEVPVEIIDLTFDNPYMFIIRDKDSGEVWFAGTVYEPVEFKSQNGIVQ